MKKYAGNMKRYEENMKKYNLVSVIMEGKYVEKKKKILCKKEDYKKVENPTNKCQEKSTVMNGLICSLRRNELMTGWENG